MLALRAIAAFLALPGVVAFVVPVWMGTSVTPRAGYVAPAVVLLCSGTLLLLWCVREFYLSGRGTLAPWDPPVHLVTSGPYRLSRNPMYVGVATILAGWCTLWPVRALVIYSVVVVIAFHLRVLLFEEPWAARRFAVEWDAYRKRVPRWIIQAPPAALLIALGRGTGEDGVMRVASVGHAVFAATLIVLGIVGLIKGDFVAVWEGVLKGVPAREGLVYLCAFISLASGIALFSPRAAATAARVLLAYLLLWWLLFKVPVILRAPTVEVSWEGGSETLVIVAGAWVLYAWFAAGWDRRHLGFATGENGVQIARVLYGASLIPFGLAHFAYAKETAALVPRWLPSPITWVYLTGCAYLAAGVAVLIRRHAPLAAALSAWQMGMFTLLVWVPIVAAGGADASQWSETLISSALTAAAWVVADSYRGMSGRAAGKGAAEFQHD